MDRKKVYVETSIVSSLTARPSSDLLATAWQKVTIDWWVTRRDEFELFVPEFQLSRSLRRLSPLLKR